MRYLDILIVCSLKHKQDFSISGLCNDLETCFKTKRAIVDLYFHEDYYVVCISLPFSEHRKLTMDLYGSSLLSLMNIATFADDMEGLIAGTEFSGVLPKYLGKQDILDIIRPYVDFTYRPARLPEVKNFKTRLVGENGTLYFLT